MPKNLPWQDVNCFNQAKLKAGEEVRFSLTCSETAQIHEELTRLYKIAEKGVPKGRHQFEVVDQSEGVVVKGPARDILKQFTRTRW